MAKTLTIIIGAGASHDLIGKGVGASVQRELEPPLANGLFSVESHNGVVQAILEQYPRAQTAAASLGSRGALSLEAVMKEMKESLELNFRRQFVQVPVYLRQLFWQICHGRFTNLPINYVDLLGRVIRSGFERIGIITTNYDTFLEDALNRHFDADFSEFRSYVADPKWALVKLHGSVDWAYRVKVGRPPSDSNDYLQQLDGFTQRLEAGVFEHLGSLQIWRNTQLWDGEGLMYPALVVPVEGKYQHLCPESHVEAARELIQGSNNFLIIGSSGLDDDLIDLLSENSGTAFTLGIVSKGDVNKVAENFQRVPMFSGSPPKIRLGNGGFTQFIESGQLSEFLGVLYDDDDRDAWIQAKDRVSGGWAVA